MALDPLLLAGTASHLVLFSHSSLANWRASVILRSLWAAQVGVLIIWAMLGDWPAFYWRYPTAALIAVPFVAQAFGGERWSAWNDVGERILVQWLTLALLAGLLRWKGYRLYRLQPNDPARGAGGKAAGPAPAAVAAGELRAHQFGVRHLLIWMTSVSLLLAVFKALDLFRILYLHGAELGGSLDIVVAGISMCLTLIIALWAAVGKEPGWLRWSVCLMVIPATGIAVESWDRWTMRAGSTTPWNLVWTVWMSLAGAMLVALLTILRGEGYRLARSK